MNINDINTKVNKGFYIWDNEFEDKFKKADLVLDEENDSDTLEYIYVTRQKFSGEYYIDDFRKSDGKIYTWTGEYWKHASDASIKESVNEWLKNNFPNRLNSKNISSISSVFIINVKEFDDEPSNELIIPTKTHWLLIDEKTGAIRAVRPCKDFPIKYQVNVEIHKKGIYRPNKLLPEKSLFKKYINSSLTDREARKLVQEYCGYSLTNTNRKQKAQAWVGGGANGKSQLIEMLQAVHPQSISVKLSNIGQYNDRLIGSSLIFATEMDKGAFDQEFFKGAVAGDCVEIRGIYGAPMQSILTAKWILIGNILPTINDFSNGVFRRLQIINWKESFEDSTDKVEDLAKIVVSDELDIFLDWCLSGLQSLIGAEWNFTESNDSKDALEDYKLSQDKVKLYCKEMGYVYDSNKKMFTSKESMFEQYNEWAKSNNFSLVSSITFWTRIRNIFPNMKKDSQDLKKNGKRICYLYRSVNDADHEADDPNFDPFASN